MSDSPDEVRVLIVRWAREYGVNGTLGSLNGLAEKVADLLASKERKLAARLDKWKSEQQSALLAMAAELLSAGFKGDGVVDGVKWLVGEVERLRQQARDISQLLDDAGVGSCTIPEGVRRVVEVAAADVKRLGWRARLTTSANVRRREAMELLAHEPHSTPHLRATCLRCACRAAMCWADASPQFEDEKGETP